MPTITSSPIRPPPPLPDAGFRQVQRLVQSFFGADRSNGVDVDGQRQVTPADWDAMLAAARRGGGIGGREFELLFNALRSMTGSGRISTAEGDRVMAQLGAGLDQQDRWSPTAHLAVLQMVAGSPTRWTSSRPLNPTPWVALISRAVAESRSSAMRTRFAADFQTLNKLPLNANTLQLAPASTRVEEVRVGERVVGRVVKTAIRVSDPRLGEVGFITSTTWLSPDGGTLRSTVTPSPAQSDELSTDVSEFR